MSDTLIRTQHAGLNIPYSTGRSRGKCKNKALPWPKFAEQFRRPTVTKETFKRYLALSVDEKNELKNVNGWWLGGHSIDGRRRKASIEERTVVTLDLEGDKFTPTMLDELRQGLQPFEMLLHTSKTHTPEKPRVRLIIPLSKPVSREDYEPVARMVAETLDPSMNAYDPVCFRVAQMMYFPSVSKDMEGEYVFDHLPGDLCDPESFLASWDRDYATLPHGDIETKLRKSDAKAQDPTEKDGIVGAFCRAYGLEEAIAEFLSDVYVEPSEGGGGETRYTYAGGEGANGAVVYSDLFLYSFHGHDPASNQLMNAFDLVRVHLYGELDDEVKDDAKPTALPSYKEMVRRFSKDERVRAEWMETKESADDAFEDLGEDEDVEYEEEEVDDGFENLDDPDAPAPTRTKKVKKELSDVEKMNRLHAMARHKGKTLVLSFNPRDKAEIEYGPVAGLHDYYANHLVPGDKGLLIPISEYWRTHPERRSYPYGVHFTPGEDKRGAYNLWTGFSVEPDPDASCELLLKHIREVIAKGHEDRYRYIVGWMAHLIQQPKDKPGVAIAIRGEEGIGKDIVANYLGKLFPGHHVKLSRPEELTGKFNALQERALLLHCEESFWAGSRNDEGPVKHLVTSETVNIERKGIDAIKMPSYLRLWITSNSDWVVKASETARRWAVFDGASTYRGDRAYFDAILDEMNGDGPAALLHFLQTYDLSDFDVRNPPATEELARQKVQSLENWKAWWYERLSEGDVPNALGAHFDDLDGTNDWAAGEYRVMADALYDDYYRWIEAKQRFGQGRPIDKRLFGKHIADITPGRVKKRLGNTGPRYHILPPLGECRTAFETYLNSKIDWYDEEDGYIPDTEDSDLLPDGHELI